MARDLVYEGQGELELTFDIDTTSTVAALRVTAGSADNPATPRAVRLATTSGNSVGIGDGSTANIPVLGQLVSVDPNADTCNVRVKGACKFQYTGTMAVGAGYKVVMSAAAVGRVKMAASTGVEARMGRGMIIDKNTTTTTIIVVL